MLFSCIPIFGRSCNGSKRSQDVIESAPPTGHLCTFTRTAMACLAIPPLLVDSAEWLTLCGPGRACGHADSQREARYRQPDLSKAIDSQVVASMPPVNWKTKCEGHHFSSKPYTKGGRCDNQASSQS